MTSLLDRPTINYWAPASPPTPAGVRRPVRTLITIALVVCLTDWTTKAIAWRIDPDVLVNYRASGLLGGSTMQDLYGHGVTGAILDLIGMAVLALAGVLLYRHQVTGWWGLALTWAGWVSNGIDRWGVHHLIAPGSARGVVDWLANFNLADVAIGLGAVLAVGALARHRLGKYMRTYRRHLSVAGLIAILIVTTNAVTSAGGATVGPAKPATTPLIIPAIDPTTEGDILLGGTALTDMYQQVVSGTTLDAGADLDHPSAGRSGPTTLVDGSVSTAWAVLGATSDGTQEWVIGDSFVDRDNGDLRTWAAVAPTRDGKLNVVVGLPRPTDLYEYYVSVSGTRDDGTYITLASEDLPARYVSGDHQVEVLEVAPTSTNRLTIYVAVVTREDAEDVFHLDNGQLVPGSVSNLTEYVLHVRLMNPDGTPWVELG